MLPAASQTARFKRDGFISLPGFLDAGQVGELVRWTEELTAMPEVPGRHMVYYEDSLVEPGTRVLSRIENFCPYHLGFDTLLREGAVAACAAALLGEPVCLFKEKINFKLPGADGFKAHQDMQAGWDQYACAHVTVLISLDAATMDNGCLEVAPGFGAGGLLGEMWKPLGEEVPDDAYRPCPTEPGDALLFDSFLPHRSGPNRTSRPRRVLYVTYNRLAEGDHRSAYYAAKRASYPPECEREAGKSYQFRGLSRVGRLEGALASALPRWVDAVCRRAGWVLALTLLSVAGSVVYTAEHLGVDTSTEDMFAGDLPWRRAHSAYRAAFPQFADTMLLVIDAPTAERADVVAREVAARLNSREGLFEWAYAPGADAFFDRHALVLLPPAELQALADRLAAAQPVLARLAADPTLHGLMELLTEMAESGRGLDAEALGRLTDRLQEGISAALAGRSAPISWQEITAGEGPEHAQRQRFVVAKPRLDFSELFPAEEAMASVRALAAELGLTLRGEPGGADQQVRLRLTGSAPLAHEELRSVTAGARTAGIGALFGVAVILVWGLGSLRLVLCALASLLVGLCWTLGFAAAAVGHLNLISIAFAVLYIGLGIDYAIHYCMRVRELALSGRAPAEALRVAAGDVGGSLAVCTLTTGVGFYAFVPTDFSGVSELGLISGTGMFISLFASLTVLPACLSVLAPSAAALSRARRRGPPLGVPLGRPGWERRLRWWVLAGTAALCIPAGWLAAHVTFDYNPLNLRDPGSESVSTFRELMVERDSPPWAISVLASGEAQARALRARLEALPSVEAVRSHFDLIPLDQARRLELIEQLDLILAGALDPPPAERPGSDATRQALVRAHQALARPELTPELRRLGEQLDPVVERLRSGGAPADVSLLALLEDNLLRYLPRSLERLSEALAAQGIEEGDLPPALAARWRSAGQYLLRVEPAEDLSDNRALARFVEEVASVAPRATGAPVINYRASAAVIEAFREAFTYAAIFIAVVLMLTFRDLMDTALVLILVLLSSLLATAALVASGLSFNFANVIALPLMLGIGVDNGVHMIHRMRIAPPERGGFLQTSTARAVVASALTTICGFGNLAFSAHRGMSSMGTLLSLGLAATLLCTLVVLPVVLELRARRPA